MGTARAGIYKIVNKLDGKVYVGSTFNFKIRWNQHVNRLNSKSHANRHLQRAWLKYGSDCFGFFEIEEVSDRSRLVEREQFYLDSYRAANSGNVYNILIVANSHIGVRKTPEQREHLSRIKKGKPGHPHSLESRAKIGSAHKGTVRGPLLDATKEKLRVAMTGRFVSETTRAKMRAARALQPNRPKKVKLAKPVVLRQAPANVELVCVLCGIAFERAASKERVASTKRKTGPFCSLLCRNKNAISRRVFRKASFVTLVCLYCGKSFDRQLCVERKNTKVRVSGPFCGAVCRNRSTAKCRL